jgi:hypothetical protein
MRVPAPPENRHRRNFFAPRSVVESLAKSFSTPERVAVAPCPDVLEASFRGVTRRSSRASALSPINNPWSGSFKCLGFCIFVFYSWEFWSAADCLRRCAKHEPVTVFIVFYRRVVRSTSVLKTCCPMRHPLSYDWHLVMVRIKWGG